MKLYAVIPTHNRPTELAALLDSIPPDVHVLVIDNASTPPVELPVRFLGRRIQVMRDEEQPPNLSRLWNIGLDWAAHLFDPDPVCRAQRIDDYAVAILNDDVVLPPDFIGKLAEQLVGKAVDIAFPGPYPERGVVNRVKVRPPSLTERMTGWCFVVRGSSGLRADERMRWWCGDNDIEMSALAHGRGTYAVPGCVFQPADGSQGLLHRFPDQSTAASPALQAQTGKDMDTYVAKWGFRPW